MVLYSVLVQGLERFGRGLGFIIRFLIGIISYEFWGFHVATKHACLILTPMCRALRLSSIPWPSSLWDVYGMAETDRSLRWFCVLGNLVGLLTYPFEFTLLLMECKALPWHEWVVTVNVAGWIIWLTTEIFRWVRQGYLAKICIAEGPEPVFFVLWKMSVSSLCRCLIDMVIAINWLPDNVLWSELVPVMWVGILGITSTILCIYNIYLIHILQTID